ncbi:MAG TPA: DUF1552 domain-containing protein [Vicinamibacterales bacterium]|nr:DUF1552 domain-containing protein [Vicinamibacterales bacterium]
MFITKMSLSRRTMLRGMGAALALPLLDAMVPAMSAIGKTPASAPPRFGAIYVPNGMAMQYWTPVAEGATYELTPILKPLEPYREQMLVFSGLHGHWNATHAGGSTSFLTGAQGQTGEVDIRIDEAMSMDQVLAKHYAQDTQLASLELALDSRGNAGQCSGGYSCVYTNTLSWASATTPLPGESNPRAVFERLFGDTGTTDAKVRRASVERDKSLLDSVMDKVSALQRQIGPSDRTKVDEYLEGIRDVERRFQKAEEQSALELPHVDQPEGIPATFAEHARLMFDMQRLAYQADLTRVCTLMMGREQTGRVYTEIGVPEAHHPLSHHRNDPAKIATMSKINVFHVQLLAEYLGKLKATPDGDGSLLDHMMILYGAGMSNSNSHDHHNLPLVLLGGGGGRLKGGRHLKYKDNTPSANLLVSIMDKMGVPQERIGDSSGTLNIDTLSGV